MVLGLCHIFPVEFVLFYLFLSRVLRDMAAANADSEYTIMAGAAPPDHRCVADSAARRFGGRAARRPSSGRRLVSSCDGPMPALPAFIFLSISVPSTLRRHVYYTWRGRWLNF